MSDRYAVMGNPVAHSKSPFIHSLFAKQTHSSLTYEAILAPKDGFEETVDRFIQEGGKGLNVTLPFKEKAFHYVDHLNEHAQQAKAVNTIIVNSDGSTTGDNTDGIGLCRDLINNHDVQLKEKRILLLGAGGAARGILKPLLDERPALMHIANRTEEKAHALANEFSRYGHVEASGFDALFDKQFDIIINATSASLHDRFPDIPLELLTPNTVCCDLMYGDQLTLFLRKASEHGVKHCIDGLGMLVEQAAESFYLWRGVRPDAYAVIEYFKNQSSMSEVKK